MFDENAKMKFSIMKTRFLLSHSLGLLMLTYFAALLLLPAKTVKPKTTFMKKILCLASLFCSVIAFGQVATNHVEADHINSSTWQLYLDNPEVKIELKREDCDIKSGLAQQYIFVRLTNKTQNTLTLNWEMDMFYNGNCLTCGVGEYEWSYTLEPAQSVEGECTLDADKRLRIFSKFIDPNYTNTSVLTGFKFSNLTLD